MFRTFRAFRFLFVAPFVLALLVIINLMTSPAHWWVKWPCPRDCHSLGDLFVARDSRSNCGRGAGRADGLLSQEIMGLTVGPAERALAFWDSMMQSWYTRRYS